MADLRRLRAINPGEASERACRPTKKETRVEIILQQCHANKVSLSDMAAARGSTGDPAQKPGQLFLLLLAHASAVFFENCGSIIARKSSRDMGKWEPHKRKLVTNKNGMATNVDCGPINPWEVQQHCKASAATFSAPRVTTLFTRTSLVSFLSYHRALIECSELNSKFFGH